MNVRGCVAFDLGGLLDWGRVMAMFIGGPFDGQDISFSEMKHIVLIPVKSLQESLSFWKENDLVPVHKIRTEEYRLSRIRGEKLVFEIYLHSKMSVDTMMQRLIDNYRPSQITEPAVEGE
jgi:hypothetical protein